MDNNNNNNNKERVFIKGREISREVGQKKANEGVISGKVSKAKRKREFWEKESKPLLFPVILKCFLWQNYA